MTVTRHFLPWYRQGLAAALGGAPAAGTARAALPATISVRGTTLTSPLPGELAGPGDVIGLDAAEIVRTEPYDGCADFEPSYFPYVELRHTDLPWRFSPFGPENAPAGVPAASGTRLRPWLCLVCVRAEAAQLTPAQPGGVAMLGVDSSELPDPAEAWAWAHVQAVSSELEPVAQALADPAASAARLIAPRRLEAAVRYLCCLVPAFAAGRAAFDASIPGGPLAPAWTPGGGSVELPVYFSFSFTTGEEGSFESLARKLRPEPTPGSMAGATIDTSDPGWGARSAAAPGTSEVMHGALAPLGSSEPAREEPLAAGIAAAISQSGAALELRPPIYGQDYQHGTSQLAATQPGWLPGLNCDPRRRAAAGLAAWAIVVDQDELVDEAWRQLAAQAPPDTAQLARGVQQSPDLAGVVKGALARHENATMTSAPAALQRLVRAGGPIAPHGIAAALVRAAGASATPDAGSPPDGDVAPASTSARFAPHFDVPAYAYLRAVASEWLLPGASDIPDNSVLLVQANTAFVEAFLVGLNHAMARELAWRRYPIDPAQTMFRTFWSAAPHDPSAGPDLGDLPEDIASWPADSELGSHTHRPDQLVLLCRGALFRRFPTAQIYLSATQGDGSEQHTTPTIAGSIGADIVFFGFPVSAQDARSATPPLSIVIAEAVYHARFGADDAPAAGGEQQLASWQDLDWGNPQLVGRTYAPIAGPLLGTSRPVSAVPGSPSATWGLSSAHQAVILQQPAFRLRVPVALWLGPLLGH